VGEIKTLKNQHPQHQEGIEMRPVLAGGSDRSIPLLF